MVGFLQNQLLLVLFLLQSVADCWFVFFGILARVSTDVIIWLTKANVNRRNSQFGLRLVGLNQQSNLLTVHGVATLCQDELGQETTSTCYLAIISITTCMIKQKS